MNEHAKNAVKILCCFLVCFSLLSAAEIEDAQAKFDAGQYQEALDIMKPYIELNVNDTRGLILAGRVYFKLGYMNEAKVNIDKAIELDKANKEYREIRNEMASFVSLTTEAKRLKNDGKYGEAKDKYAELLKLNENFADGFFQYGQVLLQLNEAAAGAKALKRSIELRPEETKYSEAYNYFVSKSLSDGNDFLKRRNYDKAQAEFNNVLILDDTQHLAHFFMSRTYYAQRNYDAALNSVNNCLKIKSDYINGIIMKGNILMKTNKLDDALAAYKSILEYDKKSASAWGKIGFINYRRKAYDDAIPAYNEVIKLKPKSAKPFETLGVIYSEKKEWDAAIENLVKATELNSKNATSWYRLAAAYNAKDMAQKAKDAANSSLIKKPKYAPALIELGAAERRLGNKDAARNAFRMAAKDPKWKKLAEFELETVK